MNAVLKLLRNFAEQLFKALITISSYWSSTVFLTTLICSGLPLNVLKKQSLDLLHIAKFCQLTCLFSTD